MATVIVKGLPRDIRAEMLRPLLSQFGTIETEKVLLDRENEISSYCVKFIHPDSALAAKDELDSSVILGRRVRVQLLQADESSPWKTPISTKKQAKSVNRFATTGRTNEQD